MEQFVIGGPPLRIAVYCLDAVSLSFLTSSVALANAADSDEEYESNLLKIVPHGSPGVQPIGEGEVRPFLGWNPEDLARNTMAFRGQGEMSDGVFVLASRELAEWEAFEVFQLPEEVERTGPTLALESAKVDIKLAARLARHFDLNYSLDEWLWDREPDEHGVYRPCPLDEPTASPPPPAGEDPVDSQPVQTTPRMYLLDSGRIYSTGKERPIGYTITTYATPEGETSTVVDELTVNDDGGWLRSDGTVHRRAERPVTS